MIFSGTRLPDQIRIALEEERLVVFAGAGVSVPPPSSLPLFNELASRIGSGASVQPGREDRFLGKLAREGTIVHSAAAQLLYNDTTRPTQLHHEILRLFGFADKVRVVTTNFDDHFSAAGSKLYRRTRIREYYAPALPLGDDFSGLVYLHGSARSDPQKMVLTDQDFGHAYLTRGWARDFLVSLFSKYTVLFVGYSHSDITTTYLARGMNQSDIKPRWSLVPATLSAEARENWAHLDISLIEHPLDSNNATNSYQPLTDFMSEWATHSKQGLLARAKRIRAIARALPPENETVAEFLEYCLSHPNLAREFCDGIRHPAWIGWLDENGFFAFFFTDTTAEAKHRAHFVFAHWLCNFVRTRFPHLLLKLMQMHDQRFTDDFSRILEGALSISGGQKSDPHFNIWIALLLGQKNRALTPEALSSLLSECVLPKHDGIAYCLFDNLTAPELQLRLGTDWSNLDEDERANHKRIEFSIDWHDETKFWIAKAWSDVFRPHLKFAADRLSQIVVKHFMHATDLLRGSSGTAMSFDELYWRRSSIAPHEQNEISSDEVFSILIDILRDILDHWISTDPKRAKSQVEMWWSMDYPVLSRFVAYAKSVDPQYSPDERINWVISNNLLFRSGMKKEVFDIIAVGYPNATKSTRRRLIRRIKAGSKEREDRGLDERTLAYERFNILVWLRRSDHTCSVVRDGIEEILSVHPEFQERGQPQFDFWHSDGDELREEVVLDVERILASTPAAFIEEVRRPDKRWNPFAAREMVERLPELFAGDRGWGRDFLKLLADEVKTDTHLWDAGLRAYGKSDTEARDWDWLLGLFETVRPSAALFKGIAYHLSHEIWNSEPSLPEEIIERARRLIAKAWELCRIESEIPVDTYRNWLTAAINDVGGWIAEFWFRYCNHQKKLLGDGWSGIPSHLKTSIGDALTGVDRTSVYARIALTPWINYFLAWDRDFTLAYFLPVLDWARDSVVAQQSWSVLLNYKRSTSSELEAQLMPFYKQFAGRVKGMLRHTTEKADQFGQQALRRLGYSLAGLAMEVEEHPVQSGFFREFLPLLPDEIRAALATGMGNYLQDYDDERRKNVWNSWLYQYLKERSLGIPVALSIPEGNQMLAWCLHLLPVFDQAVDCISKMSRSKVFAYGLIEALKESPALSEFPLHSCRLANAALEADEMPYSNPSLMTLYQAFKKAIPKTDELRQFKELLYNRGMRDL